MRAARTALSSALALALTVLPFAAQAQSSSFDDAFDRRGAEARLSLSIPFGGSTDTAKSAPRLDLAVRNYNAPSTGAQDWMLADRQDFSETRLGFTLDDTQTLMLNDQALYTPEDAEQANIGTAGKVGLGVVAVALSLVAIAAVLLLTYECEDCD